MTLKVESNYLLWLVALSQLILVVNCTPPSCFLGCLNAVSHLCPRGHSDVKCHSANSAIMVSCLEQSCSSQLQFFSARDHFYGVCQEFGFSPPSAAIPHPPKKHKPPKYGYKRTQSYNIAVPKNTSIHKVGNRYMGQLEPELSHATGSGRNKQLSSSTSPLKKPKFDQPMKTTFQTDDSIAEIQDESFASLESDSRLPDYKSQFHQRLKDTSNQFTKFSKKKSLRKLTSDQHLGFSRVRAGSSRQRVNN